jgi:hypothetical protein
MKHPNSLSRGRLAIQSNKATKQATYMPLTRKESWQLFYLNLVNWSYRVKKIKAAIPAAFFSLLKKEKAKDGNT